MSNLKMQPGSWFMMPKFIFDESELSSKARLVYAYLCRYAGNQIFPSYRTIRKACAINTDYTVNKALKELEKAGLLKVTQRYTKDGGKTSNLYTIVVPGAENDPEMRPLLDRLSRASSGQKKLAMQLLQRLLDAEEGAKEEEKTKEVPAAPPDEEPTADEVSPLNQKKTYGNFGKVLLSQNEYNQLLDVYEDYEVEQQISELDSYIATGTAKNYSNHFVVLSRWLKRKMEKDREDESRMWRQYHKEDWYPK